MSETDLMLAAFTGCADRRFHTDQLDVFMAATGLEATSIWVQHAAGGPATIVEQGAFITTDYALDHGAMIFGWGQHGDNCGGRPGRSNGELASDLLGIVPVITARYPNATHLFMFSTQLDFGPVTEVVKLVDPGHLLTIET